MLDRFVGTLHLLLKKLFRDTSQFYQIYLNILDEIPKQSCETAFAGLSSSKGKMRDNELFPKDSLSLMSPEGPPWFRLS